MKFIVSLTDSKEQRQHFKADKSFETRAKVTKRTVAIGQAFGLGIDEAKRFTVYKDFEIEILPGQVVLITGDSGSGKSILLREICEQARQSGEFGKVIDGSSVRISPKETLIEGVGRDVSDAISTLSMAGLNEAFLMLRKYCELSDGQKYRYRIAKMIDNSKAGLWAFDEFAAVLDRVTAKVVSYTVQKTARKLGKAVVVATTHEDLLEDLKPDIWIRKSFGQAVSVKTYDYKADFSRECTLLKDIQIERCTLKEVTDLEQFHYRGGFSGPTRACFKATVKETGELVGAIVFVYCHFSLKGRNIAFPEYAKMKRDSEYLRKLNREMSRIARVIVSPKFRSIGLGAELVRRTMPICGTPRVETLAIMAEYSPFFERAGMRRVDVPEDLNYNSALSKLKENFGFRPELMPSREYNQKLLAGIRSKAKLAKIADFALKYCVAKKFKKPELIPHVRALDKAALAEALHCIRGRPVYLFWSR